VAAKVNPRRAITGALLLGCILGNDAVKHSNPHASILSWEWAPASDLAFEFAAAWSVSGKFKSR
jgi:hypothetical protein